MDDKNRTANFTYGPGYLAVCALALAAAAAHFTVLHYVLNKDFPLASLQALIDGTGHTPFQFRVLVPRLVGILHDLTGASVVRLYQIVEGVSVAGLVLGMRFFLRPYFRPPLVDVFAFATVLLLPWNYMLPREIALVIPSDIPAVLFFALLLGLMHRKNWAGYYALFPVATLNRETTCFVTLVFLLVHWRKLPHRELLAHLGAQVLIWGGIKLWLRLLYVNNPGAVLELAGVGGETHLWLNLRFLADPVRVLILLSSFGFLWIPVLLWNRLIGDAFVRRALLAFVPYFLAMTVIGNLNETRIFAEWIPLVFAANLLIGRRLLPG